METTAATFNKETLAKYGVNVEAAIMKYDGRWDVWSIKLNGQWVCATGIEIFALRKVALSEAPELRQYMPKHAMIVA